MTLTEVREKWSYESKLYQRARLAYQMSTKTMVDEAMMALATKRYSQAAKDRIKEEAACRRQELTYSEQAAPMSVEEYSNKYVPIKERIKNEQMAQDFLNLTLATPHMRELAKIAAKNMGITLSIRAKQLGVLEEAQRRGLLPLNEEDEEKEDSPPPLLVEDEMEPPFEN